MGASLERLGATSLPEVSRHAKRRFLRSQSVTHFVLAEIAYPSLRLGVVLSSGGGGNRKHRISRRFAQLRVNHGKPDPELREPKDSEKHVRENALPSGKIEPESTQGRADVGDVPTAQTLGTLARKVLSSSRHAESRELARAVLRLLALSKPQS
jgi:hypothetical protein